MSKCMHDWEPVATNERTARFRCTKCDNKKYVNCLATWRKTSKRVSNVYYYDPAGRLYYSRIEVQDCPASNGSEVNR